MFKKFTALLLISAFTQVYAVTPVQQASVVSAELNRTFDMLNYKLNVEWDQKDSRFFEQSVNDFEKEITALQKEGLTNEELIQHALGKIKDKQVQDDVAEMSKIIDENQMSPDEAREFTVSKLNSTYSHGASWSGSRMGLKTALIIGAIIVIICCTRNKDDRKPEHKKPERKPCYNHETNGSYPSFMSNNECYDLV